MLYRVDNRLANRRVSEFCPVTTAEKYRLTWQNGELMPTVSRGKQPAPKSIAGAYVLWAMTAGQEGREKAAGLFFSVAKNLLNKQLPLSEINHMANVLSHVPEFQGVVTAYRNGGTQALVH